MIDALVILPNIVPSNLIGILTPLQYLAGNGSLRFETCLEKTVRPHQIRDAGVVITGRNLDPQYRPIYEFAIDYGVPIISELDDNFLEPSEHLNAYFHEPERIHYLEWLLSHSGLVRVYSAYVKQLLAGKNIPAEQVVAALDWNAVAPRLPAINLNPLELVYQTSRAEVDPVFPMIEADLHRLLRTYAAIHLHIYGLQPKSLRGHSRVTFHAYQRSYRQFLHDFTRSGHAIGLAPMLDDTFHRSKTNAKFRDFSAAGVVGVYQDSVVYADVVHGETGLRTKGNPGDWVESVVWLLSDPSRLISIRNAARQYAEAHFSLESVAERWLDQLTRVSEGGQRGKGPDSIPDRWWFTNTLLPSPFKTIPTESISVGNQYLEWTQRLYQRLIPLDLRLRFRSSRQSIRAFLRRRRN